MCEWNDVYDENRQLTGRTHLRGTPWPAGDYGLVVCCWVYDGEGNFLLTRRAPEKSFPGTWENSGGAAKAGETSLQAMARELWEETGIRASESEFEPIDQDSDSCIFYDFYCLRKKVPLSKIVLLPGETDDVIWADYETIHRMVGEGKICQVIGKQFLRQEPMLRMRNMPK